MPNYSSNTKFNRQAAKIDFTLIDERDIDVLKTHVSEMLDGLIAAKIAFIRSRESRYDISTPHLLKSTLKIKL